MQSTSSRASFAGFRGIGRWIVAVGMIPVLIVVVMVGSLLVGAPAMLHAATSPMAVDVPPPTVTLNDFFPEDRDLSDCLSALPKPGCGSESRGGWTQTMVMLLIIAGLGVIVWRIRAGMKRAARDQQTGRDEPVR